MLPIKEVKELQRQRTEIEEQNQNFRNLSEGITRQNERYMKMIIQNQQDQRKLAQQIELNHQKYYELGQKLEADRKAKK